MIPFFHIHLLLAVPILFSRRGTIVPFLLPDKYKEYSRKKEGGKRGIALFIEFHLAIQLVTCLDFSRYIAELVATQHVQHILIGMVIFIESYLFNKNNVTL